MSDRNGKCMDTIIYECMGTIKDNKKSRKSFSDSRLCIFYQASSVSSSTGAGKFCSLALKPPPSASVFFTKEVRMVP